MKIMVEDIVIEVGGIGGVATHPDYRRKGLMKNLLEFAISKMKERGCALSFLWGDRQRYGNFGWELGGRNLIITITLRSLLWQQVKPKIVKRYSDEELEKIIGIHEKEELKVKRSREVYSLLIQKADVETWVGESSYIILAGEGTTRQVIECGGDHLEVLSIFLWFMQEFKVEKLEVWRPYRYSRLNHTLIETSSHWHIEPLVSIKIINLNKTLEGFKGQFSEGNRILSPSSKMEDFQTLQLYTG